MESSLDTWLQETCGLLRDAIPTIEEKCESGMMTKLDHNCMYNLLSVGPFLALYTAVIVVVWVCRVSGY